jgi:hypothetical protein
MIAAVRVFIEIGKECAIVMDHMALLESLHNEFLVNPNYRFIKDQFLGYTESHDGPEGISFYYLLNYRFVYPLPAFPQAYQEKIIDYFNLQVEKAKLSGVWPETDMYYPLDKSEANTLWGIWRYDDGPYDSYYETATHWDDLRGAVLTLYNRERTNPETFHKDPLIMSKDLSDDMIGILYDYGGEEPADYIQKGYTFLEQVEGDLTQGVLKLRCLYDGDYFNETIYAKFDLDLKSDKIEDDLLTIEYFDTLIEAQAGFTGNEIIYSRLIPEKRPPWNYEVFRFIIYIGVGGVVLITAIITSVILIVRRRKKKKVQL